MKKMPFTRKTIITIGSILWIAVVIAAAISIHHNTKNHHRLSPNTAQVSNNTAVTFPCPVHSNTSMDSTNSSNSAECEAPWAAPYHGALYSAMAENASNVKQASESSVNYCTAKTSYPGVHPGAVTYIMDPQTMTVNGKSFSTCILSSGTTQGLAYQARAYVMNGDTTLLLEINPPTRTTDTALESNMQAFMKNVHFN